MGRFLARFVLPALLFATGIYFLLQAPGARPLLSYFLSALFIGMGLAAAQRGWSDRDRE